MRLFAKRDGSNFSKSEPNWHINKQLKGVDAFGKEVPAFNIKGSPTINTPIGGFVTASIMTLTLFYTIIKV